MMAFLRSKVLICIALAISLDHANSAATPTNMSPIPSTTSLGTTSVAETSQSTTATTSGQTTDVKNVSIDVKNDVDKTTQNVAGSIIAHLNKVGSSTSTGNDSKSDVVVARLSQNVIPPNVVSNLVSFSYSIAKSLVRILKQRNMFHL